MLFTKLINGLIAVTARDTIYFKIRSKTTKTRFLIFLSLLSAHHFPSYLDLKIQFLIYSNKFTVPQTRKFQSNQSILLTKTFKNTLTYGLLFQFRCFQSTQKLPIKSVPSEENFSLKIKFFYALKGSITILKSIPNTSKSVNCIFSQVKWQYFSEIRFVR